MRLGQNGWVSSFLRGEYAHNCNLYFMQPCNYPRYILDIGFTLYLLNEEFFFTDDIRDWVRKKIRSYYGRKSNTLLEEDQNGN